MALYHIEESINPVRRDHTPVVGEGLLVFLGLQLGIKGINLGTAII